MQAFWVLLGYIYEILVPITRLTGSKICAKVEKQVFITRLFPDDLQELIMNIREQRRSFIKKSSALAAGWLVAPGIIRAQENKPKLNIGLIGLSGKGASNLAGVLSENIVALCDVDENNAVKARSAHPNAKFFQDYRKLIDLKELDAIVVSTPDHVHAVQAIAVMQSGRPVLDLSDRMSSFPFS